MTALTKHTLNSVVHNALLQTSLNPREFPDLALRILQSGAIELDRPEHDAKITNPRYAEFIVVGKASKQGIITSGKNVNVFSLATVLLTAAAAASQSTFLSLSTLLTTLLSACAVNLSPKQAAFFLASESLKNQGTIPTAQAIKKTMGEFLGNPEFSEDQMMSVIQELNELGVVISIGDSPNHIIRHNEAKVFLPGL